LDPETGFLNNWAIGPDSLLEIDTLYDYAGSEPGEWLWAAAESGLPRDQTNPLDVVVQFPRAAVGDADAFDFFVMGQNFPDASPDDALPDTAVEFFGDFFTYELTDAVSVLQAGDADQDLKFDQLDLVRVQIAAKYLTGLAATWGEGDWNGAPGGAVGSPPAGDGLFNQLDIIAALGGNKYLMGPYASLRTLSSDREIAMPRADMAQSGTVAIPEPASWQALLCGGLMVFLIVFRIPPAPRSAGRC
jgi:hypothetical protein